MKLEAFWPKKAWHGMAYYSIMTKGCLSYRGENPQIYSLSQDNAAARVILLLLYNCLAGKKIGSVSEIF
jgi:hypothetical protein